MSMSWPPQREPNEALAPVENRRFGAVSLSLFGGVGLNLVSAPEDQADAGSSRVPSVIGAPV
jgi:hypothetical protein